MPSLPFSAFLITCVIFLLSVVLFTSCVKYAEVAIAQSPDEKINTLLPYTSAAPLSTLIATIVLIFSAHFELTLPSLLYHLYSLLLLSTWTLHIPLWTRCELLLTDNPLPSLCPASIRSHHINTYNEPIWPDLSIVRVAFASAIAVAFAALLVVTGVMAWDEWRAWRKRRRSENGESVDGMEIRQYFELEERDGRRTWHVKSYEIGEDGGVVRQMRGGGSGSGSGRSRNTGGNFI